MGGVKKNWSAGVMATLDLVREEVGCRRLLCAFSLGALTPVAMWLEDKDMTKKQICELAK